MVTIIFELLFRESFVLFFLYCVFFQQLFCLNYCVLFHLNFCQMLRCQFVVWLRDVDVFFFVVSCLIMCRCLPVCWTIKKYKKAVLSHSLHVWRMFVCDCVTVVFCVAESESGSVSFSALFVLINVATQTSCVCVGCLCAIQKYLCSNQVNWCLSYFCKKYFCYVLFGAVGVSPSWLSSCA